MTHVLTVKCPECNRYWTGEFANNQIQSAPCRDCINEDPQLIKGHPEVRINPKGR